MRLKLFLNTLILFIALFLILVKIWLFRYFGVVDFERLLIFSNFGFQGLVDTENYVVKKFVQICIILPSFFLAFFLLVMRYCVKKKFFFVNYFKKNYFIFNIIFFIFSIFYVSAQLDVSQVFNKNKFDFIKENYKNIGLDKITKKQDKTNDLIIIYLESFEENFLNPNFVSDEVIKNLEFKKYNSKKVKKFISSKYNTFTIGGIVSSQCGIPQKPVGIFDTEINDKKNRGKHNKSGGIGLNVFLPKAICLGDILKKFEYENIFLSAINSSFQATDIFYSQHGYQQIIDKNYFNKNVDKKNFSTWAGGVSDSILFNEAKSIINELKNRGKNFNLNILTTDTHHPGYIDKNCQAVFKKNDEDLTKAITCTSNSLNKLVEYVFQNWGTTTSIVIVGDHLYPIEKNILKQDSKYAPLPKIIESKTDSRFIYNRFLTNDFIVKREIMTHYDLFPTILDTLNIDYGSKIGLGYSVVKKTDLNYNEYLKKLIKNIGNESKFYYDFWK
jgi:phosphoglycerol transferase